MSIEKPSPPVGGGFSGILYLVSFPVLGKSDRKRYNSKECFELGRVIYDHYDRKLYEKLR